MTDDAPRDLHDGYAYSPGESPAYVYIPPGTRHSFRCGSTVGRVYNTLVPGGFDHGITENGTPAPRVVMPPPGTSALAVWEQIAAGRPATAWQGEQGVDVASW